MGRRSINTTKSGKYMNPTDQARKEARKKELKKNKRQRQMVRAAVLKNKDPAQILEEMEKIDEMEYNVLQPSPLNEKVLRDKRKKLKDTFDRVMRLYHNDEPEHWSELKRKEMEYEKKRLKKQQYYESVKHAQSVQIDEIPLPSSTQAPPTNNINMGTGIVFPGPKSLPPPPTTAVSLPSFPPTAPSGTAKTGETNKTQPIPSSNVLKRTDILGVPPGPPPELIDMSDLDTDAEDDEVVLKEYNPKKAKKNIPKPNSLQQRMLAISGQNIDEFMKEMESVHKKNQRDGKHAAGELDSENDEDDKARRKENYSSDDSDDDADSVKKHKRRRRSNSGSPIRREVVNENKVPSGVQTAPAMPPPMPPHMQNTFPPHMPALARPAVPTAVTGIGPPTLLYRPPPLRPPGGIPAFGMRMPLGPPGPRPPNMGNMPPRMGVRMPPGPPPGLPPRMPHHHKNAPKDAGSKGVTTISAKPQIRNLSADVTRFVPSTLRVRREETRKPNRSKASFATEIKIQQVAEANKAATKDDAYLQFMNEMQGLL